MSSPEHRAGGPSAVRVFVLTISDTRTEETDTGGKTIASLICDGGHVLVDKVIVKDDPAQVSDTVRLRAASGEVDVIISTGGTGITRRDSTFEAIDSLLEKRLPGFGELFRMLSYQDIGAAAMMSRACAGTVGSVVVAALPGSPAAVQLAMTKLLLPEMTHLVQQARR